MRWDFGTVIVDSDTREVLRDGRPVTISAKGFQLLEVLLEHRPNVVAKSQLHDRLWPDTFVVDANLANLIGEVRRALNDDRKEPRFIRTVHRFGYAFVGDAGPISRQDPIDPMWRVVWRGGHALLGNGEHLIGRQPGATVLLDSPSVSRRHARVHVVGDSATFEDLGSKNGSSVAGRPIHATVELADGDVITAGVVELTFRVFRPMATESIASSSRAGALEDLKQP